MTVDLCVCVCVFVCARAQGVGEVCMGGVGTCLGENMNLKIRYFCNLPALLEGRCTINVVKTSR